ncbi:MAG: hypothetical protein MJK14_05190 [Rivularia sp. ALOHA_DT_140]|nr:hypothetical protein [Rivularia sp. ALOHA_DT_140]
MPFGIGGTEWEPDDTEKRAAWSLFVELVTRITIQPLESKTDQGLLREALKSLHSLFGTTREILKQAGPDIGASHKSVGGIAITVLNKGLRPFLVKWHPLLQSWEAQRPLNVSPFEHEQNWQYEEQLRSELETLRHNLEEYAIALAVITGVDYCI